MDQIDYAAMTGENGKETAQRVAAGTAGTAAATAVAGAAAAIGCGSVLCTVGAPVVLGVTAAAGAASAVGWIWDTLFD